MRKGLSVPSAPGLYTGNHNTNSLVVCLAQPLPVSRPESRVSICPHPGPGDTHHATRGPVPGCGSNLGRCPGEPPAAAAGARAAGASLTIVPSGTLGDTHGDHNRIPCSGLGRRRQEKPPLFSRTTLPRSPRDELASRVATVCTLVALGVETQIAEFSPPRPHGLGEGAGRGAGPCASQTLLPFWDEEKAGLRLQRDFRSTSSLSSLSGLLQSQVTLVRPSAAWVSELIPSRRRNLTTGFARVWLPADESKGLPGELTPGMPLECRAQETPRGPTWSPTLLQSN